jgi:hypothetical protein
MRHALHHIVPEVEYANHPVGLKLLSRLSQSEKLLFRTGSAFRERDRVIRTRPMRGKVVSQPTSHRLFHGNGEPLDEGVSEKEHPLYLSTFLRGFNIM